MRPPGGFERVRRRAEPVVGGDGGPKGPSVGRVDGREAGNVDLGTAAERRRRRTRARRSLHAQPRRRRWRGRVDRVRRAEARGPRQRGAVEAQRRRRGVLMVGVVRPCRERGVVVTEGRV